MNKAVFLDKDGTLIHDVPYNVEPALIELVPDAVPALKALQEDGFLLIVISNQSGVARGYFTGEALTVVSDYIGDILLKQGITINGFYYCPHYPSGKVEAYSYECDCRKPKPGLILQAIEDFDIDASQSWMIGDAASDVEAGNAAGCKTILINKGNKTEERFGEQSQPVYIVTGLSEAANIVLQNE